MVQFMDDTTSLGSELAQIRSCLEGMSRRLETIESRVEEITSVPSAVKYEEAARLLSCSVTVIKEMIRDKRLKQTAEKIGQRKRIPMTEIFRLTATRSAPSSPPAPLEANKRAIAKVRAKSQAQVDADEADAIRAIGKKFRRNGGRP